MTRLIKVRTVPRGYVRVDEERFLDDVSSIVNGHSKAELFMGLYRLLGAPQDGGEWSYMVRHNNVVVRLTAGNEILCEVWVSPGFIQDAKRRRTRVVNIIARRLNEEGKVFVSDDTLYYPIRLKNEALMKKVEYSREITDSALTDEEKGLIYGGLMQFVPEVGEKITEIVKIVTDEKV